MLTSIRKVEFMQRCESSLVMFITVVCVLFLIKIFQRFGMIFFFCGGGDVRRSKQSKYKKEQ